MIELTGTEKQIAWANKIRANLMGEIERWTVNVKAQAVRSGMSEEQAESEFQTHIAPVIAKIQDQSSASWWIDNRGHNGVTLMQQVAK